MQAASPPAAAPAPAPAPAPASDPEGRGASTSRSSPVDDGPDVVNVNGQRWTPRVPTFVKEDARKDERTKTKLNNGQNDAKTVMNLFLLFLPPAWITDTIKYTNLLLDDSDALNKKIDKGELLRFYGYMLALTLQDYLPLDKMWKRQQVAGTTAPPPCFGRFGMTQNRFMKLKSKLRFGPSDSASFDANPWCFVETLIDAWKKHMNEVIIPGWLLAPDESMIAWLGKVGLNDINKCPHRMFVRRKPEPLGVEIKATGDALSELILFMEIVKGKAEKIKPKYWNKENGATAATTMRLSENWFGTGRVVAGDSWFASVRTAEQMLLNGLHFIGDVKTGTSRFPLAYLKEHTHEENGSWATLTSTLDIDGEKKLVYAVSHRRGESVHGFVATCGTTLSGEAHKAYFEDMEERVMAPCERGLRDHTQGGAHS
uniref:PiggyBac transposable element-derived protein domain-containing protein n=1 Tax=Haptolina ericina TaxID=156174 RepID=A0A7S3F473_9EUKA|mmetsp:Transcript_52365/g.117634  ORF Transcript_52365/g.117634 Transcript_52365/m.117634 type:complete len:428 (+) Transcript_52365:498-1781(+)